MRIWMLLWAAAFGLLVAPSVSAESPPSADDAAMVADDDLGLDLEADPVAEMGAAPANAAAHVEAKPTSSQVQTTELENHARRVATEEAASTPTPAAASDAATAAAESAAVQPVIEAPVDTDLVDGAVLAGDDGDVELDIDESPDAKPDATTSASRAAAGASVAMGPMAVDDEGRIGRIHTVTSGDTLWDISNAYLGTPWVWPAVWNDNEGISNPHRIAPGDRIWITAGEMRIVSEEEAHEMISAVPGDELADEDGEVAFEEIAPASVGDEDELLEAATPTSMEELPVAVPAEPARTARTGAMVRVSEAESLGFVSPDVLDAASSIVGSPEERVWLAEGDRVYLGLGEGQTKVGDEFTIYRDTAEVRDLDGTLLGYHVEVLGWAVVRSTDPESSMAEVRQSQYELRRGDRVIPRDPVVINVPVKVSPDALPGHIIYMPDSRTAMGDGEWVYLDRGSLHGVEPGTEMEVYVPGEFVKDPVSREKVLTPDDVVGEMIIVDTQPDSSVAYIVHSERALRVGDKVRPVVPRVAQR